MASWSTSNHSLQSWARGWGHSIEAYLFRQPTSNERYFYCYPKKTNGLLVPEGKDPSLVLLGIPLRAEHRRYSHLLICCLENTFCFSFVTSCQLSQSSSPGRQGRELLPWGNLFEELEQIENKQLTALTLNTYSNV